MTSSVLMTDELGAMKQNGNGQWEKGYELAGNACRARGYPAVVRKVVV